MSTARVARFPGTAGRIPDFTGAEAAAGGSGHALPGWPPGTLQANPDSQCPLRRRALRMERRCAWPSLRLAGPEPVLCPGSPLT